MVSQNLLLLLLACLKALDMNYTITQPIKMLMEQIGNQLLMKIL